MGLVDDVARLKRQMADAVTEITTVDGSPLTSQRDGQSVMLDCDDLSDSVWCGIIQSVAQTTSGSNQWQYTIAEGNERYGTGGYAGIVPGGRTCVAVNRGEAPNTPLGIQGSGDNMANFAAGASLQPIGVGAQVEIHSGYDCTGTLVYWFYGNLNNVNGSCD